MQKPGVEGAEGVPGTGLVNSVQVVRDLPSPRLETSVSCPVEG
jgi:hypothetical protein